MSKIIELPSLGFIEAFNSSTGKIFQFSGRARRSEYWWTQAIVFAINIILTPLIGFLADLATIPLTVRRLHDTGRSGWWYAVSFILKTAFIFFLIFDFCMACINADELKGYGDTLILAIIAKYILWALGIGVYQFILLIFMCLDSEKCSNKYGDSPKYKEVPDEQPEVMP